MNKNVPFSILLGLTLTSITGCEVDDDCVDFVTDTGSKFQLYHYQDCCEHVRIVDVVGDVNDLIGTPITLAEEVSNGDQPADYVVEVDDYSSSTWTFYKLATVKGYVDIRWLGESNGYYSESVEFVEIEAN